ncbi:DUF4231 domain-containing protein [Streptomyces harbinensis]|uniref:SLATT domain-containing protein n=1 Tax=Streptomyces harbinensis TaxID=1176198 RepID=UPI003390EB8E
MTTPESDREESDIILGEGSSTANFDLAQSRFALHDNRVLLDNAILKKKQSWGAFLVLTGAWATLVLANTFTDPPLPAFLIYLVALFGSILLLVWIFKRIATKSAEISELTSKRKKLRDSEKSALMRLSTEAEKNILWNYHSDSALVVDEYRTAASKSRRVGNWFQGFVIVASVGVSLLTTASGQFPGLQWPAVVVSFLVAAATSLSGYFKFKERGANMQRAADDLEYEHTSAELGINSYRSLNSRAERLREFAERAEKIKLDQRKREQQLEQGPQIRGVQATDNS